MANWNLLIAMTAFAAFISATMIGLIYIPSWILLISLICMGFIVPLGRIYVTKPSQFPWARTLTRQKRDRVWFVLVESSILVVALYQLTHSSNDYAFDTMAWLWIVVIALFSMLLGVALGQLAPAKDNDNGDIDGSR
ncbi:hypothetical protein [Maricaulis maris]|uniref:Transmembrane protein n=1 Tax=Maricaulis maris TaxID=74318 RepID=A0A495DL86_9PROT|nr:hypothetical protein [Maricaulis maris]RKR03675.1 hypothetical protein C7435_0112 [Maricaulis maris]